MTAPDEVSDIVVHPGPIVALGDEFPSLALTWVTDSARVVAVL